MLFLDHVAVLGESLEEAVAHAEAALRCPMLPGGAHPRYGTHNQLLGLGDGVYVEAIAVDPSAAAPEGARWFGLDRFAGAARLDKWICRVPDMEAALRTLPMAGAPVALSRGTLRWVMAVPGDGMLPFDGLFPALIEWQSPVPPGISLPESGTTLERLTVAHPEAGALEDLLGPHLDAPKVRFVTEPRPALRAELLTPTGPRLLQ